MKPKNSLFAFLALAGSSLLAVCSASAATLYWDSDGTTAGFGTTDGTWGTDVFWGTVAAGTGATANTTTTSLDDLNFGTTTDGYTGTVTVNGTQNARLLAFGAASGAVTLTGGTILLGNGGGVTVEAGAANNATISSSLTVSGSQTLNVGAGRTLTLDTGTFTRNPGATLNFQGAGTITSTMTNLATGSMVNGIVGPWATVGTGASTRYATFSGNDIVAYTGGTAATTAANVTNTGGTFNYDVAGGNATLGTGANINTLRYTGPGATIVGALTTAGIMNVSGNALTFSGAMTGGTGGLVINAANGSISFSSTMNNGGNMLTVDGSGSTTINGLVSGAGGLTKNGTGQLHLNYGSGGNPTYSGPTILNGGILRLGGGGSGSNLSGLPTGNITVNGGVFDVYWGDTFTRALGTGTSQIQITGGVSGFSQVGSTGQTLNIKFGNTNTPIVWGDALFNPTVLVLNSANGTGNVDFQNSLNLSGGDRTFRADKAFVNGTATVSGVISNTTGTAGLIKTGVGNLVLTNTNTYNGNTTVSQGGLTAATTGALPGWNSTGKISVASGAVLGVRGGASWTQANIDTLISNVSWADSTSALGFDTTSANFTYASTLSGAYSVVKYGSANTLTLNSDLSALGGSLILVDGTIARTAGGNLVTNSIEVQNGTISANIGGTTAVTKTTAGVVTLSGANTYSGGFTLTNGQVAGITGNYAGFGSGTLTVTGGNMHFSGTTTIANDMIWNGSHQFSRPGTGTPIATFTGDVNMTGNFTTTISATQPPSGIVFSGDIGETGGARLLSLSGNSPYTLSGDNTFSGGLTYGGGNTLNINSATALGTGTFTHNGGNLNNTSGSAVTLSNNNDQAWNSDFFFLGSNDLNMGTGAVTMNNNRTVTVSAGTFTVGGAIGQSGGNRNLIKAGAGTMVLGGASTYAGTTTVQQGNLIAAANAPSGSAGAFGNATSEIVLGVAGSNNAAGVLTNGAFTIGRSIRNATSNDTDGGTRALTLGGNSAHASVFSGNIFLGTSGQTSKGIRLTAVAGGQVTFSGVIQETGGTRTAGEISAAAALDSVTKVGAGTVILSNANTYTGATVINEGVLEVSGTGSIANTAGITINTGGELKYGNNAGLNRDVTVNGGTFRYNATTAYSGTLNYTSGTLAGNNLSGALDNQVINTGKSISPGNSPGTATTGSQTWGTDGSYLWEVNNATGTAGVDPGWDLLSGTGTLDITSTGADPFVILVTSLQLDNNAGLATNFNDASSYSWLIADFDEITGFAANLFSIDTSNFDNTFTGTFGITMLNDGGSIATKDGIYLTYAPIPEPGAALLGGIGILLILRRRRC